MMSFCVAEDRVAVSKKSVRPASHGDGLANAVEATTDARSTAPAGLVADVLSLQTVAGNQAVQRLIARAETASTRVALAVQRAGPDAGAPAAAPPEVLAVVLDHLADQPAVTYATVKARI